MAQILESVSSGNILEIKNNDVTKASVDVNGVISGTGFTATSASASVKDSNGLARFIPNGTAKTIVDSSATTLFTVAAPKGGAIGGTIHFSVFASDGTDHQTISGIATYGAVNKAGTVTSAITYDTDNEAKAVSSGTLTLAFTMAEDSADVVSIKLQPTGSLTETAYTVVYSVFPLRGAVTIA
jgi:hypothetical protein